MNEVVDYNEKFLIGQQVFFLDNQSVRENPQQWHQRGREGKRCQDVLLALLTVCFQQNHGQGHQLL